MRSVRVGQTLVTGSHIERKTSSVRPHSFALHHTLISVHPPTGCDPTWLMEGTLRLTQTMNQVESYSRHPCCSSSGVVFFCKNTCIHNVYTCKRLEYMMSTTHRGSPVITLVVTCLGAFMILLDASIVTLDLPRIQVDLHANLSDLQWTIDAYTLPFAVLMLTAGTFGDRFGRKRLFLVGLVLFLIGDRKSTRLNSSHT